MCVGTCPPGAMSTSEEDEEGRGVAKNDHRGLRRGDERTRKPSWTMKVGVGVDEERRGQRGGGGEGQRSLKTCSSFKTFSSSSIRAVKPASLVNSLPASTNRPTACQPLSHLVLTQPARRGGTEHQEVGNCISQQSKVRSYLSSPSLTPSSSYTNMHTCAICNIILPLR